MSITLTVASTTVTLSSDLYWEDEFNWSPVAQSVERSITGALLIQASALQAGREITLRSFDQVSGAITAADLAQLKAWASVPNQVMQLSLRGVSRDVLFRHQETAIEATPFEHYSDVQPGDFYLVTLRFMEI
jgi:hypothetical protein